MLSFLARSLSAKGKRGAARSKEAPNGEEARSGEDAFSGPDGETVQAADESISRREEATIEQIARELGVPHKEMVRIRSTYRDKRAVLKNLPR